MHVMPFIKSGLFAAFGIGFLLSRLWAGEAREDVHHRGTLESVDAAGRSLTIRTGSRETPQQIQWDEETRFYDVDGPITADELKPGQRLWVVSSQKKKIHRALRVEVEPVYGEETLSGGVLG